MNMTLTHSTASSLKRLLEKNTGKPDSFFEQFFPPTPQLSVQQSKFLRALTYQPGITLVKSPKGSGKTEALKTLVEQIREKQFRQVQSKKDHPKSVLLIGHRQSLIREAANKLGLACYLNKQDDDVCDWRDGYSICLDTLYKITEPAGYDQHSHERRVAPPRYDVVILDESEQVFSHLLSDTITKGAGCERIYHSLQFVLKQAKAVYALDADLGLITAHTLKALRESDWADRCRIIYNKPIEPTERRSLKIFKSRNDLEQKLLSAIADGKRCYVASNSKKAINTLTEIINKKFERDISLRSITSDNSRDPRERAFVENIKTEFLKVQVLLCSPSLGTGVDISFPDGRREVDHVFGFFYPFVNTHTDIDQQIARVRNPGEISLWFDPAWFTYETNFDVVRHDLAKAYWVSSANRGLNEQGDVLYDEDDPLLMISTHVICSQRSSKKNMRRLFEKLRQANGWDVEYVDKVAPAKPTTNWKDAEKDVLERRVSGILGAADLSDADYLDLAMMKEAGEAMPPADQYAVERGEIQRSLNVSIDHGIVKRFLTEALREKVEKFSFITRDEFLLSHVLELDPAQG